MTSEFQGKGSHKGQTGNKHQMDFEIIVLMIVIHVAFTALLRKEEHSGPLCIGSGPGWEILNLGWGILKLNWGIWAKDYFLILNRLPVDLENSQNKHSS